MSSPLRSYFARAGNWLALVNTTPRPVRVNKTTAVYRRTVEGRRGRGGPLLMIGLFADAPHETLIRLSVDFARERGYPPSRQDLIKAYYGLPIADLGLYLGFAQPALFDVPLLSTGQVDLYATLTPSPTLTERQLREILYDHLVTRRVPEADYDALSDEAQERLAEYNRHFHGATLGVGRIVPLTGMWTPVLPSSAPG